MDNGYETCQEMNIVVLIPSHSLSIFTKMTVATLKREVKGHNIQIHIGYHSNLFEYTSDFSMFSDLQNHCHFHSVDEIDWMENRTNTYRYSKMHAKNLENLFKNVKYFDFDYLVVLDNDLYIKSNFVDQLIGKFPDSDIIGSCFNDIDQESNTKDHFGNDIIFAPKLSIWNLIISRKLFNMLIDNTNIIYPNFYDGVFYDTFARVLYEVNSNEEFKKGIVTTEEMSSMIDHFFYSSFNYGRGMNSGGPNGDLPFKIWESEFGDNYKKYIDSI